MKKRYFEIGIEKMSVFAFHGYYSEEQKIGKFFVLDLKLIFEVGENKSITQLSETINYETLSLILLQEMKITSQLLESVAERILNRLTKEFKFNKALIRISKTNPPMGLDIKYAYIELTQENKIGKY